MKMIFPCHANKIHFHKDLFFARFESESLWNSEMANLNMRVPLMSKECWVKLDDWSEKAPPFGSWKTMTLERWLIQITNVKYAFSSCNTRCNIKYIKWDI